jgi:hypothetical protein
MSEHSQADNWPAILLADNTIKGQFLWGEHPDPDLLYVPVVPLRSRGESQHRRGSGGQQHGGSGKRKKSSRGRGGGKGGRGSSRSAYCRSRVFLASMCSYTPCQYNHSCACCGKDHPATDCPVYDLAKAKSVSGFSK